MLKNLEYIFYSATQNKGIFNQFDAVVLRFKNIIYVS